VSIGDEVLELFDRHGWRACSERVSMAEHCTQAAVLAQEADVSDALVLATLLRQPDSGYRMAMRPGECLVLGDKWILHGREAATDPARRLQGCYLARDWVGGTFFPSDSSSNDRNCGTHKP